jgi:hypothetical protein
MKWIPDDEKLICFFNVISTSKYEKKKENIGYQDFNSSMPYYESKFCTFARAINKLTSF